MMIGKETAADLPLSHGDGRVQLAGQYLVFMGKLRVAHYDS